MNETKNTEQTRHDLYPVLCTGRFKCLDDLTRSGDMLKKEIETLKTRLDACGCQPEAIN
jgi:hypothetical protein